MKNIFVVFFSILILSSCESEQVNEAATNIKQNADTLKGDSIVKKVNEIIDTSAVDLGKYFFDNPYRDINNFYISVGNGFIDSVNHAESNRGYIEEEKDICIRDNCESYLTFSDENNKPVFYFFKSDRGDYGFGNDQYFLINGTISFIRNFNVNVGEWPTDSTPTIWKVEEVTYDFRFNKLKCTSRVVLTKKIDQFDFSLRGAQTKEMQCDYKITFKEKSTELKKHLERKNSKHRD